MSNHPIHSYDSGLMTPANGMERIGAVLSHGSLLLMLPFFVPLAVLLIFPLIQPGSAYVRHQAIQATLFHLFALIAGGALWGATWALWALILIGWPFAIVMTIVSSLFTIWTLWIALVATWKAFQGVPYRLPVVGGFGD